MTKRMIKKWLCLSIALLLTGSGMKAATGPRFVTISGTDLMQPNGKKLFIQGTNLGNWLNPEGYMFGFEKTNSYWMIDQMFCQLVGPDATADFWQAFKDRYVTRQDIAYISSTGCNTVRLPFNYKLFTDEDYMGLSSGQDGFVRIDSLVEWCRASGLYLILDMHDCPGGQTGDNIDNSYGYPWLFESKRSLNLFCDIWQKIALHYKDEPVVLGYELMNEPIAPYFGEQVEVFNGRLERVYKQAVKAIRKVDDRHIILLGGSQWNGNFKPFADWKFDDKIMYTCHRYGGSPEKSAFKDIIDFRDRTGLPMYMGETGHNTDDWQAKLCQMMKANNISYTFWPYKKVDSSCMTAVRRPTDWDSTIVKFAETDRTTYQQMRQARPSQSHARQVMQQYLDNILCARCTPQVEYIRSMGLKNKR